jgi:predicted enzyme related to lactoylglutathione lyase
MAIQLVVPLLRVSDVARSIHWYRSVLGFVAEPHFREIFAAYRTLGVVTRQMELMPYGLVEFEISDPDGYVLCLSQNLEDTSDLQRPAV